LATARAGKLLNYDSLAASYWQQQIANVREFRHRIVNKSETVPGRVVPDDDELVIGTGRRLNMAGLFLDISRLLVTSG
jgi:hypothetical protein